MSAGARTLSTLYLVGYGAIYSGWLFHRSHEGTGFPYSGGYLLFLAMAALPFLVPVALARLSRRGVLRKALFALVPLLVLLALAYVASAAVYYWRQEHLFDPFVQIPAPRLETPRIPKGPGVFRILALGGSTTGGDRDLTPSTRYPAVLERILRARYPSLRIEVFNAGQSWYTTRHSLINYVTYYQDWEPDLVVEMHAINDLVRSFSPPGYAVGPFDELYTHYYGPAIHGARPPSFERIVGEVLDRWTFKPRTFWFSIPVPRLIEVDLPLERFPSITPFEGNLRKTIRAVRSNGSDLMLVTQPSIYRPDLGEPERRLLKFGRSFCATRRNWMQQEVPSAASLGRGMKAFNDVVRRLSASEGVLLCEGEAAVEKSAACFLDDVHYRPRGAEALARAVADAITRSGVIERRSTR